VALVRAVAASGPAAAFVGLVASPCPAGLSPSPSWSSCGSGSWSSLALAAGLGLFVAVFPVLAPGAPLPSSFLPAWPGGAWVPVAARPGVPAGSGWAWSPCQPSLF